MESYEKYYILWLVFSSISCAISCLLVLNILLTPRLWGLFFQQLSFALAVFDIIRLKFYLLIKSCSANSNCYSTSSFFVGNKYSAPFSQCSGQEYQLQIGSLLKAFFTVVICGISMNILRRMKSPTQMEIVKAALLVLPVPIACVIVLVKCEASKLYCVKDHKVFESDGKSVAVHAYIWAFLLPIYLCVFLNLLFYYYSYWMVVERRNKHGTSDEDALFLIVKKLKVYPLIFAVCWLPRAVAVTVDLATGKMFQVLWPLSVICIASSGTAVGIQYFRHQQIFPDVSGLYPISSNSSFFSSAASSRWMHSTTTTSVAHNSERPSEGVDMNTVTPESQNDSSSKSPTEPPQGSRAPTLSTVESSGSGSGANRGRGRSSTMGSQGSVQVSSGGTAVLETFNALQSEHMRPSDVSSVISDEV